jgi:lysophospholipase L1-like esterase
MMKGFHNLLLMAGSLCCALLLGEGALRVAGAAFNGSFYQTDTERGWSLRPNTQGWEIGETKNYVRINSDGLHDREHAVVKPPQTLRIAVLGDSLTEGMQQPIEKAFASIVEQQLAHCSALGSRQVEVINFGVSGYGTGQELLTLQSKVWKYNPDIVLLSFYAGNDVFNNYRDFNPSVGADQCPYFSLQHDELVLDDSFRNSPDLRPSAMRWQNVRAKIVNHSLVVQLIYSVLNTYRQRVTAKNLGAKTTQQFPSLDDQMYLAPENTKLEEAWSVTEALLAETNREARAHGAEFWIVSLWTSQQVSPDPVTRQQFCHQLDLPNLSYPDLRLQALSTKENIPLILLAPAVAAYTEKHRVFVNGGVLIPPGTGHPNELGHWLAGNLIACELCSRSAAIAGSASAPTEQASIPCPAQSGARERVN